MSTKYWMAPIALLLLAGCTTKSEVTVTGTDTDSLLSSPAGVASNSFLDLEGGLGYKLDVLPIRIALDGEQTSAMQVAPLPSCVQTTFPTTGTTLLTFGPGCKGANGWALTGTLQYTQIGTTSPRVHDVTYAMTLTDTTATKTWTYTGTKRVTVTATTATVTVAAGTHVTVAYADRSDTSKNKTYYYTPNLTADWATVGMIKVFGTYAFQQVPGDTVTATILQANPLIWTAGCCYPTSGTITLAVGPATAEAVFGPTCTTMKLNGNNIALNPCN